jgi:hypothetical protein
MKKVNDYITLKEKISSAKMNKILDDLKVFWAFGNSQFEEGLKQIDEKKENMTSIGMGGFIPKKNLKEYIKQMTDYQTWYVKEVKKLDANQVIRYELNNYECYYSGDITDAFKVLEEFGFTKEDVLKVFHNKNYILDQKEN